MPTITKLSLNLQHGGTGNNREASVTFTAIFNNPEVLASAVFKADVRIQSDDGDRVFPIGSTFVHATNTPAPTTLSRTFTRTNLDEDPDVVITKGGVEERENKDEWKAIVTLSPAVFETVAASSPIVVGSWGIEGQD